MTFAELEKKCKKRRIKKAVFGGLAVTAFFAAGCFVYLLNTKTEAKKPKTVVKKDNAKNIPKPAVQKAVQNIPDKTVEKKEKTVLKPVIDLNIKEPSVRKTKKEIKKPKNVPKPKTVKKTVHKQKSVIAKNLPSYKTCISLSKKFYEKGEYKNALKWAKNANIQDNRLPESWILSAKSLYKLGKKEEALKILEIYYSYHKDDKIKKLIRELNEKK